MISSRRLRPLALALCLGLGVAVAGGPADAVEAPPGSKNFTPPPDVPNYFSNESGPFHSGATARSAGPDAFPVVAAPASPGGRAIASRRTSQHHHPAHLAKAGGAKAKGRTRLAHGGASGHRQVAHAGTARRGHAAESKIAHAGATRRGHAVGPKVAHAGAARRGHAAELKIAHAPAGHLAGKTVAAKSRAASTKAKHPARAHG